MGELAFTEASDSDFIELSRTQHGKLVKKHILSKGTLNYRGQRIAIDDAFFEKLRVNFDSKVCPIVQVPVVNENNQHSEDPLRNVGEVVDLSFEGDNAYALIDVRDKVALQKIEDKLLIGASAMLSMDYQDTRDGFRKGPTLLHVAITNRPHEVDLEEYEVLAMSADSSERAVLLTASPKETPMDLEDLTSLLLEEHGIDLAALQTAATELETANAERETVAALSAAVRDAVADSDIVALSADASGEDIVAAVKTIITEHVALSAEVTEAKAEAERVAAEAAVAAEEARKAAAEAEIEALVKEGRILPAKRERQLELLLSNEELFRDLLPEEPVVKLSAEEQGVEPTDETPEKTLEETLADETTRLAALAESTGISVR